MDKCLDQECSKPKSDIVIDESDSVCGQILPCNHKCVFKSSDCLNGKLHRPCEENCERILICGHKCQNKCGEACQPCSRMKCLFQCHHKKCKSTCQVI